MAPAAGGSGSASMAAAICTSSPSPSACRTRRSATAVPGRHLLDQPGDERAVAGGRIEPEVTVVVGLVAVRRWRR